VTDPTDPRGASPRARRPVRVQRFWLVILLVLAGAGGLVLLSALMAPERQKDIWVELAKSGAQVVVLVLATGVVGAMLRDRDALREQQRRHEAYLLAFLEQIEVTYGQVKTARRMLRTMGFDASRTMTLTADQATGFRVQMALLNEAELSFETYARKVAVMPGLWEAESASMAAELTSLYQYLHGVLTEWQMDPTVLAAGADTSALQGWLKFRQFLGYDQASVRAFEDGVADRMLAVELLIRAADKPALSPLLQRRRREPSAQE
jgi:hypothetical protein